MAIEKVLIQNNTSIIQDEVCHAYCVALHYVILGQSATVQNKKGAPGLDFVLVHIACYIWYSSFFFLADSPLCHRV